MGVLCRCHGRRLKDVPGAVWGRPQLATSKVADFMVSKVADLMNWAQGLDLAHDLRPRLLRRVPLRRQPVRCLLPPLAVPVRLHDRCQNTHQQDGVGPPHKSVTHSFVQPDLRFRFGYG